MTAITITDLNNAKLDVDHIAELATSTNLTATDRLGRTKRTMEGALAEYPNAFANAAAALASATAASLSEDAALASKLSAEAARDAANYSGKVFTDTTAGIAGTTSGQTFIVVSVDLKTIIVYLNSAGTAVEQTRYYTKAFMDSIVEGLFSTDPDYLWTVLDSARRRILAVQADGTFIAKQVGHTPLMLDTLDGDLYVIEDANGRKLLTIERDGTIVGKFSVAENTELVAARGSRSDLNTRISQHLDTYGMPKIHQWGEWYMRETRQRLRKRLLGESKQLVIASIGDSWTHNVDRWTGPTAATLKTTYGDAGPGWTGFAWGFPTYGTGINGCVSSEMAVTLSANWAVHYAGYTTSTSPDICDIYTSTSGAKVTATFSGTGNTSAVNLHYIAGAGSIRYRWNAGSWTTLDTSVGSGLTVASLASMPTGTWALEIENVSGTTTLCGVDVQKTTDGVRWHKLGATGSAATHWQAVNAAQWQTAITSLAPNLVIISLATNDQGLYTASTFKTYLQTIITRVKAALPLADILLVCPCENGRGLANLMSTYASATYELAATNKCGFIDLQYLFGETFSEYASTSNRPWFNADTIHPDPLTGGRVIVDAVTRFLTN